MNPNNGNDGDDAQVYYQYLYQQYYQDIPANRTEILWSGPVTIALWAVILIGFFYLYARSLSGAHRKHGELYGAASFAGAILERIGRVSTFTKVVFVVVFLAALYQIVVSIMNGFYY